MILLYRFNNYISFTEESLHMFFKIEFMPDVMQILKYRTCSHWLIPHYFDIHERNTVNVNFAALTVLSQLASSIVDPPIISSEFVDNFDLSVRGFHRLSIIYFEFLDSHHSSVVSNIQSSYEKGKKSKHEFDDSSRVAFNRHLKALIHLRNLLSMIKICYKHCNLNTNSSCTLEYTPIEKMANSMNIMCITMIRQNSYCCSIDNQNLMSNLLTIAIVDESCHWGRTCDPGETPITPKSDFFVNIISTMNKAVSGVMQLHNDSSIGVANSLADKDSYVAFETQLWVVVPALFDVVRLTALSEPKVTLLIN